MATWLTPLLASVLFAATLLVVAAAVAGLGRVLPPLPYGLGLVAPAAALVALALLVACGGELPFGKIEALLQ